jgi:predicted transport protein
MCRDVTMVGHHGNGDVETGINSLNEMDYVVALIQQAFEWQREDVNE